MARRATQGSFRPTGPALVALGAACWGFDTPLRQPLTGSLDSGLIVLYEHLILAPALLLLLWRLRRHWRPLGAAKWAAVIWIAWGGSALGTVCYTQAVKLGNPTAVVFLQKLQPLFAVALARWWLGETEPVRRRFWLRMAVALVAASLISFGDRVAWEDLFDVRGTAALFAVAAAAIWGSCTAVGRYALTSVPPLALMALRVLIAIPLLLALNLAGQPHLSLPLPRAEDWISLLLIAVIPGLLGLTFYYRGLDRTPASVATLAELFFPASAALLNWLFLGTQIALLQIAGAALLWGAVIWRVGEKAVRRDGAAGCDPQPPRSS